MTLGKLTLSDFALQIKDKLLNPFEWVERDFIKSYLTKVFEEQKQQYVVFVMCITEEFRKLSEKEKYKSLEFHQASVIDFCKHVLMQLLILRDKALKKPCSFAPNFVEYALDRLLGKQGIVYVEEGAWYKEDLENIEGLYGFYKKRGRGGG